MIFTSHTLLKLVFTVACKVSTSNLSVRLPAGWRKLDKSAGICLVFCLLRSYNSFNIQATEITWIEANFSGLWFDLLFNRILLHSFLSLSMVLKTCQRRINVLYLNIKGDCLRYHVTHPARAGRYPYQPAHLSGWAPIWVTGKLAGDEIDLEESVRLLQTCQEIEIVKMARK